MAKVILAFIQDEAARGHGMPSRDDIRQFVGWKSLSGVYDVLRVLASQGHIVLPKRGRARLAIPRRDDDYIRAREVAMRAAGVK